jgi:hypothetical protein
MHQQIAVSLPPEALLGAEWGKLQPGAALMLAAPGMPAPLQVPLTQPDGAAPVTTRCACVCVCGGGHT